MEKQDGAASVLNIVSENVLKKGKYSSKWYPCKIELKDDNLTYQRIDPKFSLFLRKQFQTVSREALIFDFDIFFFKAENNASFQKQPQLSFITLCIWSIIGSWLHKYSKKNSTLYLSLSLSAF